MQKEEKKSFRIQSNQLMLTYPGWVNKAWLRGFLPGLFEKHGTCRIEIGHETGEKGEYDHTHVVVIINKHKGYFQSTNERFADLKDPKYDESPNKVENPNIHGNYKGFLKKDIPDKMRYISKEDKANAHLLAEFGELSAAKIASYPSKGEMLKDICKDADSVKMAMNLGYIYDNVGKEKKKLDAELNKFQSALYADLQKKGNARIIRWYIDEKGGAGKTFFGKYCFREDPVKYYFIGGVTSPYHIATIIEGAIAGGWSGNTLFINLTRAAENNENLYPALECLSDGFLTSSKYKGKLIDWDPEWIIVFSNWGPDKSKLSADRWDIRSL